MVEEVKIDMHEAYCRRNIRKCDKCDEMIDKNNQDDHDNEVHQPVKCELCNLSLEVSKLDAHKKSCPQRRVGCQFCSLEYPIKEFSSHVNACGSRTNNCQFCGKLFQLKELDVHESGCTEEMRKEQARAEAEKERKRKEEARRREEILLREQEFEEKRRREAFKAEEERRKEIQKLKEVEERRKLEAETKRLEEERKKAIASRAHPAPTTSTLSRGNTGSSYGNYGVPESRKLDTKDRTSNIYNNPAPVQPTNVAASGYSAGQPSRNPVSSSGISARVASNVLPGTKVGYDKYTSSVAADTRSSKPTGLSWGTGNGVSKPSAPPVKEERFASKNSKPSYYQDSLSQATADRGYDPRSYASVARDDHAYASQLQAELNGGILSSDELIARKLQEELDAQLAKELESENNSNAHTHSPFAGAQPDPYESYKPYNEGSRAAYRNPYESGYNGRSHGSSHVRNPFEDEFDTQGYEQRGYQPPPTHSGAKVSASDYQALDEDEEAQRAILESMKTANQPAPSNSYRPGSRNTGQPYSRYR